MFGNKSDSIFWKMIKNQTANKKMQNTNDQSEKEKHFSHFLDHQSTQLDENGDIIKIIEKLPTYKKVCLLQGLLKEIKSIRTRFEDNKKFILGKIKKNCYNYYKSKIGMKDVYDYSLSNNHEKHKNYIVLENSKEKLSTNYDILYNILFFLRDNNEIMINIINNCPPNSFEQLSDFLVNFFYEDTINSSFNEEELITILYLIIEDLIINKLPNSLIPLNSNKSDNYLKDNILYYIFKSITRKVDVRNFTCTVLSDCLLKLEGLNEYLTIIVKRIEKRISEENNKQIIHIHNNMKSNRRGGISQFNNLKKRNKSIVEEMSIQPKKGSRNLRIKLFHSTTKEDNSEIMLNYLSNIDEEEPSNKLNNLEIDNKIDLDGVELNEFFYDCDVTLEYLNKIKKEYENNKDKDTITIAMQVFIDLQINQITSQNSEIFSNSSKNKDLKKYIALNKAEDSDKLVNTVIENYKKLTNFIDEIIKRLKDNIASLPYILKSITFIMEFLIIKKNSNQKGKNIDFQKLLFISNYLIGNIILPLINTPDFNGIITTNVISRITKDNLEIITKIIGKMLSGKLFTNKKDSEYTIFNKYIIDTLPKIFDIINCVILQKNFKLSKNIQKLINSVNEIGKPLRNINYDYFNENQDKIQQQSICFSWINLIILIDIIKFCKDFYKNQKYKNYSSYFEKFKKLREFCVNKYKENNNKNEYEFFFLEKIKYNEKFQENINNILQDNIFALMPNKDNDEISMFKKCLIDVLAYVNILHKENFNYFVQKNQENIIQDSDIILLLLNNGVNKKYLGLFAKEGVPSIPKDNPSIQFGNVLSYVYGLEDNENEDADFKEVIFPEIIESVKYELSHNLDENIAKRIVFCSSYLQLHIDDLPQEYKNNNYCPLLMEIMKKGEEIINNLNVYILYQFYLKFKGGEKLNMIITSNYLQVKKMEKCICIEYLFDKLVLPCKLNVKKDSTGIITNISYQPVDSSISYVHSIQSFIDIFPNFRKYEGIVDDIIDLEEKVEMDVALNAYFKDLKALIKNEDIIKRYSYEEMETIFFELENYIFLKLHDKLFPKESTKKDNKFYKKCCRLDFVKPEQLIKDKKTINEKLWKNSMDLINEMDLKLTPQDKVNNFGKAFSILQNSITFCSGKKDLGIDDTISSLIYVLLKSKPKNIFSNSKYCQLFLDPDLSKKQFGILLSQMEMIKNIINDMKYSDLIGVTEEEFGKDEEE